MWEEIRARDKNNKYKSQFSIKIFWVCIMVFNLRLIICVVTSQIALVATGRNYIV
jgi:hypothetical protein